MSKIEQKDTKIRQTKEVLSWKSHKNDITKEISLTELEFISADHNMTSI